VQPIELVSTAPAVRSGQVAHSPLQNDWSSVVLESSGWPLNAMAPLWAFASGDRAGGADSFSRLEQATGDGGAYEGQMRVRSLETAITPEHCR
jgi:hypothetical protein